MTPDRQAQVPSKLRQALGFLVSGGTAFAIDAGVLELGIRVFGLDPLVARIAAIALAMIAGWLCHRTLTFAVATAPSLAEFTLYAASAWVVALVNYACFAAILLFAPAVEPFVALVVASVIAMTISYVSMRYAVFRRT